MLKSAVLATLGILLTASAALADGARPAVASSPPANGSIIPRSGSIIPRVGPIIPNAPNIVPNPPPERVERPGRGQRHVGVVYVTPPVIYAEPSQCVAPGYWAYQWIPTAYTQSSWMPGYWTTDGVWVDGHVEQRAYSSGYYQPYWVPDQPYAC